MNSLCKKTLLGFKDTDIESPINRLIDILVNYDGDVENLSLDDLRNDAPIAPMNSEEFRDFRICNISFRNFRTFPQHNLPYGLEFTKTADEPCSLFLVGKNGTGKSTIFDALEWIYAGKVSNAEDRGVNSQDKLFEYLTYGFNLVPGISPDNVELKICIKGDGILDYNWKYLKDLHPLCVPAICCSDMDIEEIAKLSEEGVDNNDGEYQRFIRIQLGYEDLKILKDSLSRLSSEIQTYLKKLQDRRRLAYLSASDVISVTCFLEKLVDRGIVKNRNWIGRFLRFSKVSEIKKITDHKQPRVILGSDNYGFENLWNEVLQNVEKLNSQTEEDGSDNLNLYLNPDIAENGQEDRHFDGRSVVEGLKNQINIKMKHLSAMYNLLKDAYSIYQDNSLGAGLLKTMNKLQKDYDFLISDDNTLPTGEMEIDRVLVPIRQIAEPLPRLIQKIESFLSHLFEVAEDENENEDNTRYRSKYPTNLNIFVMDVLNHYIEKGESFNVEVKSNSFEVKIEVNDIDGRHFDANPRAYLNTFRFRLFAVLLKIALAFYYMKENRCVAPIIIDDVFNASDFENSVSLNTFIFTIFDVYQKLLGGEIPLQLIILTHDEMIANAFRHGVKMKSPEMMARIRDAKIATPDQYCIFGRLFHYLESGEINKAEDKDRSFLNLYLKTNN